MNKYLFDKKDNTLPLMAGDRLERLAELINEEPAALSTVSISELTCCYNLEILERVLRQVLPERLDNAITIISKRWEIDVDDRVARVVYFDTQLRTYVPYTKDLPDRLEEIKQRIVRRRQLESELQQEEQALLNLHNSSATQTQSEPADVKNQTEAPQFAEENQTPQEDEVVYHLADLPQKVQKMILLDDETYHLFHKILREEIMPLIESNKYQYANLVRFICNLRCITNRHSDMPQWAELYKNIIPEVMPILSSMKQRKDANNDKNYKYYDDPKKCTNDDCWQLHHDGPEIEEILKPVIDRLAS